MTDLQSSLIAIGGVILVGVLSYNKWQEHMARRSVYQAFPVAHDDVLMKSDASSGDTRHLQRQEPAMSPASTVASDQEAASEFEPYLKTALASTSEQAGHAAPVSLEEDAPQEPVFSLPRPRKTLPVDELIDCTIPIALDAQVRGDKLLPLLQKLRQVGNKPVQFIGQNSSNGEWEAVSRGSVYNALAAGVQLANRNSPLNELEYSELVMRLHEITETIGASPDVPDMIKVIQNAHILHRFISEHDVQLSVNVRSNGAPWNIVTLLAALTRQGFDRRTGSTLVMQDGENEVLFSLTTNVGVTTEVTDCLTLLLDVPRVDPERDGYGALVACARSLAMRLGGTLVDDGNQVLSEDALSDIAGQVGAFYGAMEAAEIPAGSGRALRLFS